MREKTLDIELPVLAPGLVGLVQGVALLAGQDSDELLAISSAAFCNYVFDPALNTHEDVPRSFSPYAALFSNYGPWESIAYYTGWEVLEVNALPAVESLEIVVFEIEGARPIVTLTPDLEPTLVTGYQVSVEDRIVRTAAGEFTVRDDARLQGEGAVFKNWLLLVRPGQQPDWAASQVRQQIGVLRWAAEHADNNQEFFQETSENYAPGLLGIERFRAFLDGLSDPAGVAYAERYMRSLHAARSAAATSLRRWADPIAEELANDTVGAHLRAASDAYREVAAALATAANFSDAMGDAHKNEVVAVAALRAAAVSFPTAFEAL